MLLLREAHVNLCKHVLQWLPKCICYNIFTRDGPHQAVEKVALLVFGYSSSHDHDQIPHTESVPNIT